MITKITISVPTSAADRSIQAQKFKQDAQGELPVDLPQDLLIGDNEVELDAGQGVRVFIKPELID